jgi:hypothetical protein
MVVVVVVVIIVITLRNTGKFFSALRAANDHIVGFTHL